MLPDDQRHRADRSLVHGQLPSRISNAIQPGICDGGGAIAGEVAKPHDPLPAYAATWYSCTAAGDVRYSGTIIDGEIDAYGTTQLQCEQEGAITAQNTSSSTSRACRAGRTRSATAVVLALLGLPAWLAAQQPEFPSAVEVVRVDAVVLDRDGRPVEGLRASDFELLENGRPQAITSFEAVVGRGRAALAVTVPRPAPPRLSNGLSSRSSTTTCTSRPPRPLPRATPSAASCSRPCGPATA